QDPHRLPRRVHEPDRRAAGALRHRRLRCRPVDRLCRLGAGRPPRAKGPAVLPAPRVHEVRRMTHPAGVLLTAILLTAAAPLHAQPGGPGMMEPGPPPGPPAFLQRVFPPKLVMEHQQELGLEQSQVDAIKEAMRETQQQLVELQWKLDAESETLDRLLSADQADEKGVPGKRGAVTGSGQGGKKAKLGPPVKKKNPPPPPQGGEAAPPPPTAPAGGAGGPAATAVSQAATASTTTGMPSDGASVM